MNIRVKIALLSSIQILVILFSLQIISEGQKIAESPLAFVPQETIDSNSQVAQTESFTGLTINQSESDEKIFFILLSLNIISFSAITVGVIKIMYIDNKKKLKTQKLATIGTLTARISHDLRNPLFSIKNSAKLIELELGSTENARVKDVLKNINKAVSRMEIQIEDVLDFVRTTRLDKQNISILDVITDALDRIRIPDEIKLVVPTRDCKVVCDPVKMEVVFVNLITNAIQAIEKGGTIQITINDTKKDYIEINVIDDGPGMDSKTLANLFEPLFSTKPNGTGLGLVSCKSIIESHNGEIKVLSKVGMGTTFKIKMPKIDKVDSSTEKNQNQLKLTNQ